MTDNRHPRDPNVMREAPHDDLGWVLTIQDYAEADGVYEDDPVDIQIKPHPDGYQIDLWWTAEDGETRKKSYSHINFEDPRDTEAT